MIRRIAAALMILPLVVGVATTMLVGDVLYPKVDEEALATARLGAWIAGLSVVVALALEAVPADPRGGSALTLLASVGAAAFAIGHDLIQGVGMAAVVVFFIPAALVALHDLRGDPFGPRSLLIRAQQRLAWIGAATGLLACKFLIEAGTRGLAVDLPMTVAGLVCAAVLAATAYLVWRSRPDVAAAATALTAVLGLALLRDSFIAQSALLAGAAFLSVRLTEYARPVIDQHAAA